MSAEIMSIFQPSLRNLAKAEERKLELHENGDDSKKKNGTRQNNERRSFTEQL